MRYRDDLDFCDVIKRVTKAGHAVDIDMVLALVVMGVDVDIAVNGVKSVCRDKTNTVKRLENITSRVRDSVSNSTVIALMQHGMSSMVPTMKNTPGNETFINRILDMLYMCNMIDFIQCYCYTTVEPRGVMHVAPQLQELDSARFVQCMADMLYFCSLSAKSNDRGLEERKIDTEESIAGAVAVHNRFPHLAGHVMSQKERSSTTVVWRRAIRAHQEKDDCDDADLFSDTTESLVREKFFLSMQFCLGSVTTDSFGVTDGGEDDPNSAYRLIDTMWKSFYQAVPEEQRYTVLAKFHAISQDHSRFPAMFMEAIVEHTNGDHDTIAYIMVLLILCNITSYRDGNRLLDILDRYEDFMDLPLTWVADMVTA